MMTAEKKKDSERERDTPQHKCFLSGKRKTKVKPNKKNEPK